MKDDKKNGVYIRSLTEITTIPITLAVGPILGYYIGDFLDNCFHTEPWLLVIMIILGTTASFKQTFFVIRKYSNDKKND